MASEIINCRVNTEMLPPVTTALFKNSSVQILASLGAASTVFISFGLMLGWPSPTYPHLLKPNATIPITIDQSAMIAGALKLGNFIATPFSTTREMDTKYGLILSMSLILSGWTILSQLESIYGLLLSRVFIGLGNGFGNGQIKLYLQEICSPFLGKLFQKYSVIFVNIGVIVAFSVGGLLCYKYLAYVGVGSSLLFLIFLTNLPQSPIYLLAQNHQENALKSLEILRRYSDADKIDQLQLEVLSNKNEKNMTLWNILKCNETRANYLVLIFLVFVQQFSGITPTTVYCQLIFISSGCPNSEFCAVLFSITYAISTIFGLKYSDNMHKKSFLVYSALLTCMTTIAQIATILHDFNLILWKYLTLVIVNVFVIVYSFGLGSVPGFYLRERFPKAAKDVAGKTFVMCSFTFGLIATKAFQVLYASHGLYMPYCMFLVATTLGSIIIMFLTLFESDKMCKNVKNQNLFFLASQ